MMFVKYEPADDRFAAYSIGISQSRHEVKVMSGKYELTFIISQDRQKHLFEV